MTPTQQDKFNQLTAIREAVSKTTLLSSILDETWFEALEKEMANSSTTGVLAVDPSGFFDSLCHPLRGAPWFEAVQELFLTGRVDEIDTDGRLALAMCGIDPVRTFIPLLDRRLKAVAELPFKQNVVETKIRQLHKIRSNKRKKFKNDLFEINVLGDLALKCVLRDIEVLPDDEKSKSCVDGVIYLDEREVFIEVTDTTREVVPRFTGARVMAVDTECQIKQVVRKLREKIAKGRQLALAKGSPTLLFLALTPYGADRLLAESAVNECFHANEFAGLSGVVLADSWKFQMTSWHPGVKPDIPLTEVEEGKLRNWYAKK